MWHSKSISLYFQPIHSWIIWPDKLKACPMIFLHSWSHFTAQCTKLGFLILNTVDIARFSFNKLKLMYFLQLIKTKQNLSPFSNLISYITAVSPITTDLGSPVITSVLCKRLTASSWASCEGQLNQTWCFANINHHRESLLLSIRLDPRIRVSDWIIMSTTRTVHEHVYIRKISLMALIVWTGHHIVQSD